MEDLKFVASYLELTGVQLALVGVLLAFLKFFAPRIWDLFKKRLELWAERKPLIPEPSDRQLLDEFCQELAVRLDDLDEQSRWEHSRFVPLDAEITILRGERKLRRVDEPVYGYKGLPAHPPVPCDRRPRLGKVGGFAQARPRHARQEKALRANSNLRQLTGMVAG